MKRTTTSPTGSAMPLTKPSTYMLLVSIVGVVRLLVVRRVDNFRKDRFILSIVSTSPAFQCALLLSWMTIDNSSSLRLERRSVPSCRLRLVKCTPNDCHLHVLSSLSTSSPSCPVKYQLQITLSLRVIDCSPSSSSTIPEPVARRQKIQQPL
jgi:hypothetical protein